MSRDPYPGTTSSPASLNAFLYANARPTVLIDPSGRDPSSVPSDLLAFLQHVGEALKPDYVRIQGGLDLPMFGPVHQVIVDRCGNVYIQPLGLAFGSPGPFISYTAGWLVQTEIPSEVDLTSFLSGPSYSGGAALGAAVDVTVSPGARGTEQALESGVGSPRAGISGGESFVLGKLLPGW